MEVTEEKAFVLNGTKLFNKKELLAAIKNLSDDQYNHFANNDYNYFSDWIFHVLEDKELAEALRSTTSRKDAIKLLKKHLKPHKEKPKKEKKVKISEKIDKIEKPVKTSSKTIEPTVEDVLEVIVKNKEHAKTVLWKYFPWELAKEFMYGLAIGIIVGLILSKIFLP